MDDQNQFSASGAGQSSGMQNDDTQGAAAGNPFGDTATPSQPAGVADTPPWLNLTPSEPAQQPAQAENTFDPFSNPFDGGFGAPAQPAPEAQPVMQPVEASYTENTTYEDQGSNDAMGLLMKLQQQFEYEEEDFQETLKMHEENIKAEQDAIRELRAQRRDKMEEMKKIILGLEKMVGLTGSNADARSHGDTRSHSDSKKASASNAARAAKKPADMQSAKKVDNDDFFTAA